MNMSFSSLVGWGCRIRQLHLCRGVRQPQPNGCPEHDMKPSDDVALVLEFWECGEPVHCHYSQVHCNPEW